MSYKDLCQWDTGWAAVPQSWPSTASSIECFVAFFFLSIMSSEKRESNTSNALSLNVKIVSNNIYVSKTVP